MLRIDLSQEEVPWDQYHLILALAFDSSIYPMVPITKMATEWDKLGLFNTFFLYQKLVKYNLIKLI